jgi:hypothetical protein
MTRTRYTIQGAANALGITESAVRKRVKRGQLEHDKEEDGRVYVYLDTRSGSSGPAPDGAPESSYPLLVARLENENEFLRRELERRSEEAAEFRRIIAGLTQRIPAIESPPEPPGSPQAASGGPGSAQGRPDRESETSRRWWEFWRA